MFFWACATVKICRIRVHFLGFNLKKKLSFTFFFRNILFRRHFVPWLTYRFFFQTQNTLSFNPAAVRKRKSRLINPAAEAKNKEKQAEAEKHMPRNFKDLSGLLQLSGHRSQDHFEGNACFTMALTSLCQSVPAINWTKNTINSILEDGHATYRDVINAANASGCGYSAVQLLRNEDLNFVGQCVAAEGRRNFIEFEHKFYGMVSGKYEEGDFYQSLKVNLRKALDVSDKVLFLCRGKWISIQKSGDWLAVFNSHSLNGHGLIETGKTAKVIITKDIGACYKLMLAGTSSVDEMAVDENLDFVEYELLAVKATEVV